MLLTAAAASGALPTLGGAAPTLVVSVREEDLATGRGHAHLPGDDEPISLAAARHIACTGAVQRVVSRAERQDRVDRDSRPGLQSPPAPRDHRFATADASFPAVTFPRSGARSITSRSIRGAGRRIRTTESCSAGSITGRSIPAAGASGWSTASRTCGVRTGGTRTGGGGPRRNPLLACATRSRSGCDASGLARRLNAPQIETTATMNAGSAASTATASRTRPTSTPARDARRSRNHGSSRGNAVVTSAPNGDNDTDREQHDRRQQKPARRGPVAATHQWKAAAQASGQGGERRALEHGERGEEQHRQPPGPDPVEVDVLSSQRVDERPDGDQEDRSERRSGPSSAGQPGLDEQEERGRCEGERQCPEDQSSATVPLERDVARRSPAPR